MDKIYTMKLHEILHYDNYEILRVPGGWFYTIFSETGCGGYHVSSVFVPFDNEFQAEHYK